MSTIDAPHAALYGALIGLAGVLIGSLSGLVSQYLAQFLIGRRELESRKRKEERALNAFRGMVSALQDMAASGAIGPHAAPRAESCEVSIGPLKRAMDEPDLYLSLAPNQVRAMFRLLAALETVLVPIQAIDRGFLEGQERIEELNELSAQVYRRLLSYCNYAALELGLSSLSVEEHRQRTKADL
jgi:hypothetical protein